MESPLFEDIRTFLPNYLTREVQQGLYEELKLFPENKNFYLTDKFPDEINQGDGWKGFVAINFDTVEKKSVSGIVLSNSCDIDLNNLQDRNPIILFAPIIRLTSYVSLLKELNKTEEFIESHLLGIKKQRNTSIFYLPACKNVIEECIVFLDDVHGHPIENFSHVEKSKLFTLNLYAFYIFLLKLSVHFTRFSENIVRMA